MLAHGGPQPAYLSDELVAGHRFEVGVQVVCGHHALLLLTLLLLLLRLLLKLLLILLALLLLLLELRLIRRRWTQPPSRRSAMW
jgi:hypothetical protein